MSYFTYRSARLVAGVLIGAMWMLASERATAAGPVASLDDRIKGADRVVVARAVNVTPRWQTNDHGDRIIVSRVVLAIEETLKGRSTLQTVLEVEGGSLDGYTLRVSGVELIRPGERAIVFLNAATPEAVHTPYLRGQGLLALAENNVIRGTSVRLDDVKARARLLAQQERR